VSTTPRDELVGPRPQPAFTSRSASAVPVRPDRHLGDSEHVQHGRAFWDTATGPRERVSVDPAHRLAQRWSAGSGILRPIRRLSGEQRLGRTSWGLLAAERPPRCYGSSCFRGIFPKSMLRGGRWSGPVTTTGGDRCSRQHRRRPRAHHASAAQGVAGRRGIWRPRCLDRAVRLAGGDLRDLGSEHVHGATRVHGHPGGRDRAECPRQGSPHGSGNRRQTAGLDNDLTVGRLTRVGARVKRNSCDLSRRTAPSPSDCLQTMALLIRSVERGMRQRP
jgi:hypothetical protein